MDEMAVINAIVPDIVQQAKSDYVGLWQIVSELREVHGVTSEAERRRLTLQVVDRLLKGGVEVVDYHRERGWARWSDQNPSAVLARIGHEWDALSSEPNLGDICWFSVSEST